MQDHVIKKLLQVLPVSSGADSRFKKTVLLRTIRSEISDASVTETTLETLELIEEMERSEGVEIRDSLKAAYCAVAVECTVKYLAGSPDKHGKYSEAVRRLWRGRIGNLVKSGMKSELVTPELTQWREDLESALSDDKTAKRLMNLNTRNEALRALRVFLGEAWALMGPSFLESAALLTEPSSDFLSWSSDQLPADNASGLAAQTVETTNAGELAVEAANRLEQEAAARLQESAANGRADEEGTRDLVFSDRAAGRGKGKFQNFNMFWLIFEMLFYQFIVLMCYTLKTNIVDCLVWLLHNYRIAFNQFLSIYIYI